MHIKNLTFGYNDTLIFKNFNFESNDNIIAIKGPSGCGKTTLLKLIFNDLKPLNIDELTFYKNKYFIIQEDALLPWLSGYDNLIKFIDIKEKDLKNHFLFSVVYSFINNKVFELSYGQRRLIELFRAILSKPNLLLLDEPFNYLDRENRIIISEILKDISKNGTNIILTSHYNEDLSILNSKVFYFQSTYPITRLFETEI